jgi:hypothetical protein
LTPALYRLLAFCLSPGLLALLTGGDVRLAFGLPVLGFVMFYAAPLPTVDWLGRPKSGVLLIIATVVMFASIAAGFVVAIRPLVM